MSRFIATRRFVLAGALAAACSPRRASTTLRLGYQKSGTPYLAKARGLVDKEITEAGIEKVEWIEFQSGPPLMEAINAGSIDLGAVGESPPIFAQAAGSRFLYVAQQPVTGANQGILVPEDSPIKTVGDLAGKRIAYTRGSSAHLFTVEALKTADLSLKDITEVALTPADAASAFAGGGIDAWAIWDPYLSLALNRGGARTLLTGETLPKTSNFYVAAPSFAESSPEILARLLEAFAREADWANANLAEAARIIAEATSLPAELLEDSMRRGPLGCNPLSDTIIRQQQQAANTFAAVGVIPQQISVEERVWKGWLRTNAGA